MDLGLDTGTDYLLQRCETLPASKQIKSIKARAQHWKGIEFRRFDGFGGYTGGGGVMWIDEGSMGG